MLVWVTQMNHMTKDLSKNLEYLLVKYSFMVRATMLEGTYKQ